MSTRRQFLQTAAGGSLASLGFTPAAHLQAEQAVQGTFRNQLLEGLGGPWPERSDLNVQLRETIPKDGYRIESLYYQVEPDEQIPAMLLVPEGVSASRPAAAVLCLHQHQFAYGKHEPAGLDGAPMHHTGVALAREGYVVLCPDMLCFGERRDAKLKDGSYERYAFLRYLVQGKCLAWKNILDIRGAVDLLAGRPEVQTDRLGCYGHSMGSTNTYMVGPWEPRLKCFVCNCCLPTYKAIHRDRLLHCFPNYVPGLLEYGDTPDIAALLAPRPLHMNFGELDAASPIDEVRQGMQRIAARYQGAGAPENFSFFIEKETGHVLSDAMWQRARGWFAKHLRG